jgi:2-polyprenyl-3-methyl-5-hydroxy-6-metoxy-1,4-benzoquinol methylase
MRAIVQPSIPTHPMLLLCMRDPQYFTRLHRIGCVERWLVSADLSSESNAQAPYLQENLWGYGKRLRFVDGAIQRQFPGSKRCELRVLDIGCGNGSQLGIPLAVGGYRVTGVDPHGPSIQRGQELAPAVDFHHGVLTDLPISKFDCVIISEVLEHLEAPEVLLSMALSYLSESGVLIITVPNGYGEFEVDRRLYQALHFDKLVDWLRPAFKSSKSKEDYGSSDEESPHLQRFTLARLRKMFERNNLLLVEGRGTSLASGPFMAHLFGKIEILIRLNAVIADHLPLSLVAGWMFALRRAR